MSWGSWAHRAFVIGAGLAVSAAALFILPLGSDAAPTTAPTAAAAPTPISIGLGGVAVSVGGVSVTVGNPTASSDPGGTVIGAVTGPVDGLLGGGKTTATVPASSHPVAPSAPMAMPTAPDSTPTPAPVTPTATPTPSQPTAIDHRPAHIATAAGDHGTAPNQSSNARIRRRASSPLGRTVVPAAPASRARHERTEAVQLIQNAIHPGDTVFVLAGVTASIAIGIAAMVVSFGRRPGVSITGQMLE